MADPSAIVRPMGGSAIYSIGAVARMVGVSVSTLRTWEDRYGVVVASRSAGGQRRYSRDQLAQLQFVAREVESGMLPGDAHRLLADRGGEAAGAGRTPESVDEDGVPVLIADRDPYAASVADYFLRTEGYRVEVASTAADAETALEALAPRVVVVDLLLSGGVGGPLFERLMETDVLVVVVSPLAASEIAAELGAHAFLQKPIDPVVLISTVRDLLGTSALTRQRARAPGT
jgi:DNA-binding transcriptional MerR regulator